MNRRRYGGPAPLVLTAFEGATLPGAVADAFRDGHLAGVFLRRENLTSLEQARALSAEIQALAGGGMPWIVAIDEEGGLVSHLAHIAPAPPAPMAIAAAGARAWEIGRRSGRLLRSLGINTVFAPVCDVNDEPSNPVIGTRAFGDDAEKVARFAAESVAGYREAQVLTTAKHFPGHGMTGEDSHATMPVVSIEEAKVGAHLRPFRTAVMSGVDLVMSAHVAYPALEASVARRVEAARDSSGLAGAAARSGEESGKTRPATLSPLLLGRLLREEIGFAGPVVSDAFEMAGLAGAGSPQEIAERGTAAGVDLWLLTPGLDALDAVERGVARVARDAGGRFVVQQAGARVNQVRLRIGGAQPVANKVPEAGTAALFEEVAAGAVTVVRSNGVVPLRARAPLFVFPGGWSPHLVIDRVAFESDVCARWPGARVLWTALDADPSVVQGADADALVVGTLNRGPMRAGQRALLEAAEALDRPLAAVALLDPYDVRAFPKRAAAIATFGARRENMQSLVQVLSGEKEATGRMPVVL